MTVLIAMLSTGKGTWAEVAKLLDSETFDKAILITNDFGKEKFSHERTVLLPLQLDQPIKALQAAIIYELKTHLSAETEIALNMQSGIGSEHMALLSALLKLGVGIRLVIGTEGGVDEL